MDESVVHALAKKVGGRFRLTALVQKRLIELNRGARPTVEPKETALRTVIEELLQGALEEEPQELDKTGTGQEEAPAAGADAQHKE